MNRIELNQLVRIMLLLHTSYEFMLHVNHNHVTVLLSLVITHVVVVVVAEQVCPD